MKGNILQWKSAGWKNDSDIVWLDIKEHTLMATRLPVFSSFDKWMENKHVCSYRSDILFRIRWSPNFNVDTLKSDKYERGGLTKDLLGGSAETL